MHRRLVTFAASIALAACAVSSASAAPLPRIVSMNVCTDQVLLTLADPDLLDRWLVQNPLPTIPYLANLYRRLSQEAIDDPDYAVGFSYFMDKELTPTKLALIWQYSILPYLAEYHVEQRARVKNWEWDSDFMREIRRET